MSEAATGLMVRVKVYTYFYSSDSGEGTCIYGTAAARDAALREDIASHMDADDIDVVALMVKYGKDTATWPIDDMLVWAEDNCIEFSIYATFIDVDLADIQAIDQSTPEKAP